MMDLNEFLQHIFRCLERRICYYGDVDFSKIDETDEPCAAFVKKICICYKSFYPMFWNEFHIFFNVVVFDENCVHILLNEHSLKIITVCDNLFHALMYVCCFTYAVLEQAVIRIDDRGWNVWNLFTSTQVMEIFRQPLIYKRFISQGGYDELCNFCLAENLPEIIDFIGDCYSRVDMLKTPIIIHEKCYFFAQDSTDNLFILKQNKENLKCLILSLYHSSGNELSTAFDRISVLKPSTY